MSVARAKTHISPGVDLAQCLSNRRWIRRDEPFPHIVAHNVFTDSVYRQMEQAFQEALTGQRFGRNMPGYDASGMVIGPGYQGPFEVFLSLAWQDLIATASGVKTTRDVMASLHHHERGSKSGRPHNDLNPGWFVDNPRADGANVADVGLCRYEDGRASDGRKPRATVRAIAVLFYLNNPPWSVGAGRQTVHERRSEQQLSVVLPVFPVFVPQLPS
jgi:hypothetical protein